MSDVLIKIKRAVVQGHYRFSQKARDEIVADGLTELDVVESIMNAVTIHKTLRSTSPRRDHRVEYLHVIQSVSLEGIFIYTKGKFARIRGEDVYYLLISSKRGI